MKRTKPPEYTFLITKSIFPVLKLSQLFTIPVLKFRNNFLSKNLLVPLFCACTLMDIEKAQCTLELQRVVNILYTDNLNVKYISVKNFLES